MRWIVCAIVGYGMGSFSAFVFPPSATTTGQEVLLLGLIGVFAWNVGTGIGWLWDELSA